MNKNLIVSSADGKYSQLLVELYNSLKFFEGYDFAVLDCGITSDAKDFFIQESIQIKKPIWEVSLPKYKIRGRDYLKGIFSRFYLDKYFPGYENYIWMDSDTWLNCFDTFNLYLEAANKNGFGICPQVDRASPKLINIKWLWNYPIKINSINYKNISKSISRKLAKKYSAHYTLNGGCFSYNSKFDGMKYIKNNLILSAKKGRIFGSDQVALILSMFEDKIPFELLPSYCNWICDHHMPKYCMSKKLFVEPFIPNHNIAVIHLAGMDEDRFNSNIIHSIKTLDNKIIKKTLRFAD